VRNRPAFTLIETLVALAIFQFAMLAMAAGAAVAARDLAAGRRMTTAHAMARNRVEWLASLSCPSTATDAVETNGYVEHWRVDPHGDRRLIRDSVVFARPNGTPDFAVIRAAILCRQ
jgi:Tfp pilus assembly protein PilV